jgi:hypothetical protein
VREKVFRSENRAILASVVRTLEAPVAPMEAGAVTSIPKGTASQYEFLSGTASAAWP